MALMPAVISMEQELCFRLKLQYHMQNATIASKQQGFEEIHCEVLQTNSNQIS